MSDSEPKPPEPPKPTTKTSTVPLKKETVRITLRARPEDTGPVPPKGATAPIPASSTAPVGATAPVPPKGGTAPVPAPTASAPAAPRPPAAPMAAPAPATPPPGAPTPPPGAKTIPLSRTPPPAPGGGGATPPPVGAKTIPLAKGPAKPGGPAIGKTSTPLGPPGAKPLPKATVQLQKTGQMGAGALATGVPASPDVKSTAADDVEEEWEEEYEESGLMPYAIAVLLLAIAVLVIEILTKMQVG